MAPTPNPSAHPEDDPAAYVGLLAESAERLARQRGWSTVRSLPPGAIVTLEYLAGRLNFEVRGGEVVRSWTG
ncbi:I78 family peptidase inhibitor [Streptomyces amakusaensis]|uniref:I78 family peptidase inhibitor n=1 Tax=Streptomyces amakusaensis TaxID=67271 RepID=A0ABW0ARL5_9ACTN